ncbi:uncharacterized protein LOC144657012 isoform X2 [Oculina patagonica]
MVRETRHLWVGNLPENIREEEIVKHFTRYGRVESVKILPKRSQEGGRAAFVDFVDIRSATKAHESVNRIGDREMRTDYNEPGNAGSLSRLHGHTDPPARTTSNSAPGSPVQRRRFDRRTEGASDGRYSGRSQTFYQDAYSDDEGAAPRVASGGGSGSGGSVNRARPRSGRDHRRQPYSHGQEPRRSTHKPEAYRDQDPSPDHSSGSESGSESSRSRSQSPSSSGSSSSEEGSRGESVHATAPSSEAPPSTNRTSALCLRNISLRSGDGSLRDGLYHEFKKHGDVSRIFVNGQGSSRYAIVHFRRPEDAERALEACRGKMFLGAEMDLQYSQDDRYESSDHPPRHRSHASSMVDDEFDPGCTRTLFVGNIEKTTTFSDLKEAFERYGEIVDVDIKKQAGNNPYAFIQFVDLSSAIQARRRMDREFVGRNRVKVGFGKVSPINTIWVGGLSGLNDQQIERHFSRYGRVTRVVVNRPREQALVSFDSVESASIAQGEMKGRSMFGRRVRVEFVSRDSRQLFFDALQRSAPSDGSSSSSRRYEPSSPRSRGRGGGYYDNRWEGRGRGGGRGNMRRDMSNQRPWQRGGGEYEYSEGGGYKRGHGRYRQPYEGGGYESDDYDQELRDYKYSQQREREKEQGRQRHDRSGRDRDREDGNYSGNERFYPENQERWREDRSSSDSYEESRARKDARPREVPDEYDRERAGYSEDDDHASLHSKPSSRDIEQDEKRVKRKEKRKRKPRSPSPEGEAVEGKEALSDGEETEEKRVFEEKKTRKIKSGEAEIALKDKEAEAEERVWDERRVHGNGTKTEEIGVKDGEKELAPASPPQEKGIKKKEKKDAKKRKKHKRIRGSLGEEEEERELEEETARMEEAAGQEAVADLAMPVNKTRVSSDTDLQRLENRDTAVPENNRLDRAEFENEKLPRRHSSDERLRKEEREFSRESVNRSPRKSHRDERRGDWEKTDVVKAKRRRTSEGESPPPPPPPPPPPREAVEGYLPPEMLPRVGPPPDGLPAQMVRPPYDMAPAPPVRYEPPIYDGSRTVPVVASPAATLSPVPPAGIPLNPVVVVPPNVSTPPLAVHSPGVPLGVPAVPTLASPQGLPPPPPPHPDYTPPPVQQPNTDTLLDLLRRYPVVWQGLLALKNDSAAVQMHYLAGNGRLAEVSLPQAPANGIGGVPPPIRIAQRMKLEPSQLEGVIRRMQSDKDHCLLLALPCGRDPLDVHKQTRALKSGFINYLQIKQAAGIINVARPGSAQPSYVLHIFPPCDFAHEHLARVSPDLLDSAADSGHLMVVVASV